MLKKLFITIAVIFILLLALLIAAPFIFKDKLIAIAKKEINTQLDAKVDFKDVGISFFHDFPNLALTLGELSIVNNAPFEGDTFALIGSFSASVNVMSVIRGSTIDVRGIFLDKPKVNVKVLKDGTANYNIIKATAEQPAKKDAPPSQVSVKLNQIRITDGIIGYNDRQSDVSAALTGLDFRGRGDFTQDVFDFTTFTTIEQATVTSGAVSYLSKAHLELKLDLGMDLPNGKYTFKDNTLRLNALVLGMDGWLSDKTTGQYDMDIKFSAKETSFKNLLSLVPAIYLKDFEKVKTAGTLALSGFAKGTYKDASYPAFGVTLKVDNAMFQYPGLPASVSEIYIDLKAESPGGDLDMTVVDIAMFNLKIGTEPLALRVHIKNPVSDPDLDVSAKGKLNLSSVKQFYPLQAGEELGGEVNADATFRGRLSALEKEQYDKVKAAGVVNISRLKYKSKDLPEGVTAEKIALVFSSGAPATSGAASLLPVKAYGALDAQNLKYADKTLPGGKADISSVYVTLHENDATLERLRVRIGKSDYSLTGSLDNVLGYILSDGILGGNLSLKSTLLDVNEWMTTEASATPAASAPETSAAESFTVPANLALDLSAGIATVLYDKTEMKNVSAKARIKDETFTLQSLTAEMLGGTIMLSGAYSTKEPAPKIELGYHFKNINIMEAVNSMSTAGKIAPVFKYMNGRFSAKGDMKGSLLSDFSLDMQSLLASGRVDISNAAVTGLPVLHRLADRFKIKELRNVNFSNAWTVFEVKNGRIAVEPFDIKVGNIAMNISGSQGIDQTIDYNILMDVPKNLLGAANELVSGLLAKSPIPGFSAAQLPDLTKFRVKVTNTLTDPTLDVSLIGGSGAAVKEHITEQIKEQAEQVKQEVSAKAKQEADKIIAEARQQAQKIREEGRKTADTVKKEGYARAKKLEDEAKNPIAKVAAQEAAKKLRKETDDKASKIIREADDKANKLEQEAQHRANRLLKGGQ